MPLMALTEPRLSNDRASLAYANLILATRVGSEVHGINVPGQDDRDEMGVYVEPPGIVIGLDQPLDHVIERTRANGERSQPGDTDRTFYGLRKYLRLAVKGNPTVLLPLFAPDSDVLHTTALGYALRARRGMFLSQEAAYRFLGYMVGQRDRMLGKGRQSSVPNRPELVERYGWDVKYGSHALRLAYQCLELVMTAHLTLPLQDDLRERVLAVKTGQVARDDVVTRIDVIEAACRKMLAEGDTPLPPRPDLEKLSDWSVHAHTWWWRQKRQRPVESTKPL